MRVAIASNDRQTIAQHFGRCGGFEVVEIQDDQITDRAYRENTFTGHARGMQGQHSDKHGAILEALEDCEVVISHGMGRRIYRDFQNAGIQSIITDKTDIHSALDAFMAGELEDFPERGCSHGAHTH